MSDAKAVGAGGAIPPAVGEVAAKANQPPAARQGKAKGKGCVKAADVWSARNVAGAKARSDALRKVCNGGKPGNVSGRTSGGVERYFAEGELTCAEGQFHVVCEEPAKAPAKAPAAAPGEAKGKQVAAAETTGNTSQPKAAPPALTAAEQAAMADLDAMMDEMR